MTPSERPKEELYIHALEIRVAVADGKGGARMTNNGGFAPAGASLYSQQYVEELERKLASQERRAAAYRNVAHAERLHGAVAAPGHDVSETTQALIDLLVARDRAGRTKYGATLDRTDLTHEEWLQHMVEELLDGAGYALATKRVTSAS